MAQCVSDPLNAPADKLLLSVLNKLGGHSAISDRYGLLLQLANEPNKIHLPITAFMRLFSTTYRTNISGKFICTRTMGNEEQRFATLDYV
ncbi:MAG: hypothetical protein RIC03_00145 [Cyclobacteriaceae bacterium]